MKIEINQTKPIKILTNAETITFTNDTTGVVNIIENAKGDYSVQALTVGIVSIPFILTKGSKTKNLDVEIIVSTVGSLEAEVYNTPKVIDLISTNNLIQFNAELETRYDDTTITDESNKVAREKDKISTIDISNNKLTLIPGKYWNKRDGLLKINTKMGSTVETIEVPVSLDYDNRSLRDFTVSNFIRENASEEYKQPFKYILDGTSKTGISDILADNVSVKNVNKNGMFDSNGNLIAKPALNPLQGTSGGKASFTASIPDNSTHEGFSIDFDIEVGTYYANNNINVDPNLNITQFPTDPLTPENSTAEIAYTDRAVGSHYIISLDPEIAYVTHHWDGGTSSNTDLDQRTGGMPYRGTITIHGRKNGIARIAWFGQSSSCSKATTIKCIKCVGFPETVDADKIRRPSANDKYYVLACLGQSNMTGFADNAYNDDDYFPNRRLAQLGYWGNNLQPDFLRPWVETSDDQVYNRGMYSNKGTHNGRTGVHFQLAKKILDAIPEDYSLLIVPVSHGNSAMIGDNNNVDTEATYDPTTMTILGSTRRIKTRTSPAKMWKKGGIMQQMSLDRIKAALELNPDNKFLGLVWCQGETDSANYTDNHVTNWGNQFKVIMKEMEDQLKDVTMFNGTKGFQFEKHSFAFRGFYQGTNNWPKYTQMMALQKTYFGTSRYFEYANAPTTALYKNAANNHYGRAAYDEISTNIATMMKTQYGEKFDKVDIASDGIDLAASLPIAYYYLLTGSNANYVHAPTTSIQYLYPTTNIPDDELSVKFDKNGVIDFDPKTGAYKLITADKSSDLPVVATIKRKATDVSTITFGSTMTNIFIQYESNDASSTLASYVPYTINSKYLEFTENMNAKTITITTQGTIDIVASNDETIATVANNSGVLTITPVAIGNTFIYVSLTQSSYENTDIIIPVSVKFSVTGKYFKMSGNGYGSTYLVATGIGEKKTYFNLDTNIPADEIVIEDEANVSQYVTFDFTNKCFTYIKSQTNNVGLAVTLKYQNYVLGVATVCFSSTASNNAPTNIDV